jgi:fatty-acyl-CoA synthase
VDIALALIDKSLRNYRADTAIRFDGVSITYGQLDPLIDAAAWRLADAGVGPGDRVALLLGNSPDYLILDVAIMRVGAVKIPLNPMLSESELLHIIEHSAADCVITNDGLADKLGRLDNGSAADAVEYNCTVASLGPGLYCQEPPPLRQFPATPRGPDDTAVIYYTGGTTGRPKGVVHTHRSVVANLLSHVIEADIRRGESMLLMTPLSHSAGLFALTGLIMGATLTLHSSFSVPALETEVAVGRASWTFVVPTMIYRLLDKVVASGSRLEGLDTIVYGASPITPDRLEQALEAIDAGFIQLYGQTECPNFGTTLDKREHQQARSNRALMGSCGKASTLSEAKVMVDGRTAEVGEVGEVCLKSPYLMSGYLDNPTATAEVLVDGWLHTGDVGIIDQRGYLHLKDRKKDMIISGGMNVYPAEVEAALQGLDGVSQVAVIGVPHETWGECVCAFIVRTDGIDLDEAAVLAHARECLGTYKRPKQVEFVEALPLTAVGKLDKKALRHAFWSADDRQIR